MAKEVKKRDFRFGTLMAYLIPRGNCRTAAAAGRNEGLMTKYRVKVDPALNVYHRAFGARIDDGNVFIPAKLSEALKSHPVGEDPVTIAGFLASFPTAVSGYLGLSPRAVMQSVEAFIELLEESGADVTSARRRTSHSHGARHPGQLQH